MASDTYFAIDDSNFARKVLRAVFDKLGYEFIGEGDSYTSALTKLKLLKNETPIKYITLDITMPDITGDKLISTILDIHPDVKIIMTTSVANKEMVQKCVKLGAKGYILKPVTEEKVLEAMNIITINSLLKKKGVDPK